MATCSLLHLPMHNRKLHLDGSWHCRLQRPGCVTYYNRYCLACSSATSTSIGSVAGPSLLMPPPHKPLQRRCLHSILKIGCSITVLRYSSSCGSRSLAVTSCRAYAPGAALSSSSPARSGSVALPSSFTRYCRAAPATIGSRCSPAIEGNACSISIPGAPAPAEACAWASAVDLLAIATGTHRRELSTCALSSAPAMPLTLTLRCTASPAACALLVGTAGRLPFLCSCKAWTLRRKASTRMLKVSVPGSRAALKTTNINNASKQKSQ